MKKVLDFQQTKKKLNIESDKALYQRVSRHQIPFRRWGGRLVFVEEEIDQFLAALPGISVEEAVAKVESVSQ